MPYEIHPSIGIARVGSSDAAGDYYFFGPEPNCMSADYGSFAPYDRARGRVRFESDGKTPLRNYRVDPDGALKRQAVRFRIFDCERDANGVLTRSREIDPQSEKLHIEWSVHLANRKAAACTFDPGKAKVRRNARDIDNREIPFPSLVIDPGLRDLSGPNFIADPVKAAFMSVAGIELAQIRTDDRERLVVVGPAGQSGSPYGSKLEHYADNDYWYDNTADGPVLATVWTLNADGSKRDRYPVANAWVVVAPFDFAPEIDSFITLYDICQQAWADKQGLPPPALGDTYFESDVLPLLKRVRGYRWVSGPVMRAETQDRHTSWRERESDLGNPGSDDGKLFRKMLFAHIPDPDGDKTGKRQVLMPRLHDPRRNGARALSDTTTADDVLRLTRIQYAHLRNWANNQFRQGARDDRECLAAALDRIALEACNGGAFYPGMEVPELVREPQIYSTPFTLRPWLENDKPKNPAGVAPDAPGTDGLAPGQLTQALAVPWQADFWACQMERDNAWWPATRPDHVFGAEPQKPLDSQSEEVYRWDEGLSAYEDMVEHWHRLGVVKRKAFPTSNFPAGDKHDPRVTADRETNTDYYFFEDERGSEFAHKLPSCGHRDGVKKAP